MARPRVEPQTFKPGPESQFDLERKAFSINLLRTLHARQRCDICNFVDQRLCHITQHLQLFVPRLGCDLIRLTSSIIIHKSGWNSSGQCRGKLCYALLWNFSSANTVESEPHDIEIQFWCECGIPFRMRNPLSKDSTWNLVPSKFP